MAKKKIDAENEELEEESLIQDSPNNNSDNKISKKALSITYVEQWVNRRYMAWLSLISIIIVTLLALFLISESRLESASDVLTWFYITLASIVGAYMGLSTWATLNRKL